MAGGGAPDPDPAIGQAALQSAQIGQAYLDFMQGQAEISNAWADEDRDRYLEVFQPIEDQLVSDALTWNTAARRRQRAEQAEADVANQFSTQRQARERRQAAMGVTPGSGRSGSLARSDRLREGLARAGARNVAQRQVDAEGEARMASAANLGRGLAVNPATSLGLASNAGASGFSGAMSGYGQQADLLNQQHQNQMATWQANQQASAGLWGGLGQLAGLAIGPTIFSSKELKTDRSAPTESPLRQVREMPVEEWTYRPGVEDGGRHIGPYAEDFAEATGRGDGRTINLGDAVGVTMGAVQELDRKVTALAEGRSLPGVVA
jgi:hypothetical protein